jgi:hypothetical protein
MKYSSLSDWTDMVSGIAITDDQFARLLAFIEKDYPADPMMQELRMIRTLSALQGGATIEQILAEYEQVA